MSHASESLMFPVGNRRTDGGVDGLSIIFQM